jgi:signal transduction histidine kinase
MALQWTQNMNVRKKLLINLFISLTGVMAVGWLGLYYVNSVAGVTYALFKTGAQPLLHNIEIQNIAQKYLLNLTSHLVEQDPDRIKALDAVLTGIDTSLLAAIAKSPDDSFNQEFMRSWNDFIKVAKLVAEKSSDYQKSEGLTLLVVEGIGKYNDAMSLLDREANEDHQKMSSLQSMALSDRERATNYMVLIVLLVVGMSMGSAFFIERSIALPIASLASTIKLMGQGDLNIRSDIKSADEIGRLADTFNTMAAELKETMAKADAAQAAVIETHRQMLEITERQNRHLEREVTDRTAEVERAELALADADEIIKLEKMRAEASARLAQLGEMATSIAHEINNPLAIISGHNYAIRKELSKAEFDREKVIASTQFVEATTQRITKIITGLRAYARDGSHEPMAVTSIKEILNDTIAMTEIRMQTKGIKMSVKNHSNADLMINCRGVQIVQTLVALLNNSVDALNGLDERWVELGTAFDGNMIEISVTDSGSGISNEIEGRIFQPFFTTKAVGVGTGLGLSIAHGILKSHGGKIFVDRSSKNTKFVMQIPADTAAMAMGAS